ncbi:hypothetical protein AAFF_G00104090 [Aldrovandia affinis]|uniref:DDE Tnp4 domain-containing protein n=1 Tax=Aldrovandia affinis TaxID=143900 RepID=A0AAD7R190_9TELE|nr:hypothetical protein AAFF_G00104090 [Aldrovandia affinis]
MVHRVTKKLLKLKNRVIHFPSHADLENVGNGFAQLAGSSAFSRVVGSIDGCQVQEVQLPSRQGQVHHRTVAGIIKTRWRSIFFKSEVIACCTILHNICVSKGDIMEPAEEVFRPDDTADQPHLHQDEQRSATAVAWNVPPGGGNKDGKLDRWPPRASLHEGGLPRPRSGFLTPSPGQ